MKKKKSKSFASGPGAGFTITIFVPWGTKFGMGRPLYEVGGIPRMPTPYEVKGILLTVVEQVEREHLYHVRQEIKLAEKKREEDESG